MRITPLDIKKQEFSRNFRGFDPDEVQSFLQLIATQWEEILNEKRQLEDKLKEAQSSLIHYQRLEEALGEAVRTAKESAQNLVDSAQQKAASIIAEAELKAEEVKKVAERGRQIAFDEKTQVEQKRDEILVRLRSFLSAEIELLKRFDDSERKVDQKVVAPTFFQGSDDLTFSTFEKGPIRFFKDDPVDTELSLEESGSTQTFEPTPQLLKFGQVTASIEADESGAEEGLATEEILASVQTEKLDVTVFPEHTLMTEKEQIPIPAVVFDDRTASQWVVRPVISSSLRNSSPMLEPDLEESIGSAAADLSTTAEEIQRIRKILQDLD